MKAQVGYGIQCNQPSTCSNETRAQLLPFSADSRDQEIVGSRFQRCVKLLLPIGPVNAPEKQT